MDRELFQLALSYHQAGNLEQAEKIYQQLLQQFPNDANLLHLCGILYAQSGNYDQALIYINEALRISPISATFHNSMGNVLWNLEKFEDAIQHYTTSLQLEPNAPSVHNNLGNIYAKNKDYSQAIKHYEKAIQLKPDYADAYYNLAITLTHINQIKDAIANLTKAIAVQPNFHQAHGQLALLLQQENNLERALYHYQQKLEMIPDHVESLVNIGTILVKQGKLDAAIEYFEHALELDPMHHEAEYNLGATYLSLQNLDAALKHFLQCLKEAPDADTYFNIGVIYMYKDYYTEAIDYFNSALQIQPDYFAAHVNLGATFLKMERYPEAIAHYQRASQIQPDNSEIQYILGALTEQKEAPDQAPLVFVEQLFDQYAPYFEKHLTECLSYQAHIEIFQMVMSEFDQPKGLIIADLGCGTGLCGALFNSVAKKLIGVDISSKMIAIAKEKNIYSELIIDNIAHALSRLRDIDLILAADVFGYIGNLEQVFTAAYSALIDKGYFAFTVEKSTTSPYLLQKSTRYAHSKDYIRELCLQNSFNILKENEIRLRLQRHDPVMGYLYLIQKTS